MNLELAGVQVRCPNCGDIYYETTETYDPAKMTTGDMLRFTTKYGPQGYNWSLPFSDHDMSEGLLCVECGGDMAPSGYLGLDRLVFDAAGLGKPLEEEDLLVKDLSGTAIIAMQAASLKMSIEEYERMAKKQNQEAGHILIPTDDEEALRTTVLSESSEAKEDPLAKYLTQKACPECGRFFGVDEFEAHLNSHPPEVRAAILKPIDPVKEEAESRAQRAESKSRTEKSKGKGKGWFKGQKSITEIMEADEPTGMQCPFCESSFEHSPEFEAHIKTHDLGGVQQAVAQ